MSKRLDENLGAVEYDGLIVSNTPVADVVRISVASGSGMLKRGTVVTGTSGSGMSPISAAIVVSNSSYILADDVDASGDAVVTATAYRTGHFARNKLIVAEGYALTAADEEILRKSGILLSDAVRY